MWWDRRICDLELRCGAVDVEEKKKKRRAGAWENGPWRPHGTETGGRAPHFPKDHCDPPAR